MAASGACLGWGMTMPADIHWHASGLHVYARCGDESHVVCRAATPQTAALIAQFPECVRVANEAADQRAALLFDADRRIDALESAARADAQLFRFHLRQIAALERRCRWTGLALAFSLSFNLLVVYALWSAYVVNP